MQKPVEFKQAFQLYFEHLSLYVIHRSKHAHIVCVGLPFKYICVCTCARVNVCVPMCTCVHACVCACACLCVCVCVCVCDSVCYSVSVLLCRVFMLCVCVSGRYIVHSSCTFLCPRQSTLYCCFLSILFLFQGDLFFLYQPSCEQDSGKRII